VALLEEETFSVPAFQWGVACWRRGIPFGVQADENLDRPLPLPARLFRAWTLRHASFVAARSPTAKELVERWGTRARVEVIPHAVPLWDDVPRPDQSQPFTIGFAGRFVEEKGLRDLVCAAHRLTGQSRLLLTGNGPLREELSSVAHNGLQVEIVSDISHDEMARAYSGMDVLVLPSRTTPSWAEQFGRVLVEALWCGVPVIGSDSGEIPWVINTTGGGVVFPEGDVDALTRRLSELRDDPFRREALARAGRQSVERLFGVPAVGRRLAEVMREVSGC
jgi:glycosyltransferase involved in cell wall biosynthesis